MFSKPIKYSDKIHTPVIRVLFLAPKLLRGHPFQSPQKIAKFSTHDQTVSFKSKMSATYVFLVEGKMMCSQHPDPQPGAQCGVQEAPNDGLVLSSPQQTLVHSPKSPNRHLDIAKKRQGKHYINVIYEVHFTQ